MKIEKINKNIIKVVVDHDDYNLDEYDEEKIPGISSMVDFSMLGNRQLMNLLKEEIKHLEN